MLSPGLSCRARVCASSPIVSLVTALSRPNLQPRHGYAVLVLMNLAIPKKNPAGVFVTAPQRFHLVGAQQESLVGLRVSRPFGILLISLHRVFFLQSATVSDDFWQHHCSGEHSTDLARECAAKDGANNQRVSSPVLPRTCEGARCQECQSAAATDDVACHCQSAQFQTDS